LLIEYVLVLFYEINVPVAITTIRIVETTTSSWMIISVMTVMTAIPQWFEKANFGTVWILEEIVWLLLDRQ